MDLKYRVDVGGSILVPRYRDPWRKHENGPVGSEKRRKFLGYLMFCYFVRKFLLRGVSQSFIQPAKDVSF